MSLHGGSSTPSSEHPGYIAGRWYSPVRTIFSAGVAIGTSGSVRMLPFVLSKPITVQALGVRVTTTSAGGNVQAAIYANNAGAPTGTPLCSTASMSTASAAAVSASVTPVTLQPGTYWMAVFHDNTAAAYQTISTTESHGGQIIGSTTLANVTSASTTGALGLSFGGATFGSWPDLTAGSFTEATAATQALVFLQAS